MAHDPHQTELEDLARRLEASPDYRVLRRLAPPHAYAELDLVPHRTAVALDVETTGLDPRTDAINRCRVKVFPGGAPSIVLRAHPNRSRRVATRSTCHMR